MSRPYRTNHMMIDRISADPSTLKTRFKIDWAAVAFFGLCIAGGVVLACWCRSMGL